MTRNTPKKGGVPPDLSRLNAETKSDSLNAPLTNSFSLKGIDDLLLGKPMTNQSLYEEDVEKLLEHISVDYEPPKYLGKIY